MTNDELLNLFTRGWKSGQGIRLFFGENVFELKPQRLDLPHGLDLTEDHMCSDGRRQLNNHNFGQSNSSAFCLAGERKVGEDGRFFRTEGFFFDAAEVTGVEFFPL